jgi:poly(3-hydroxybutyrate) depolymerase
MKKTLSVILIAILIFSFAFMASAEPYKSSEALEMESEFVLGEGPEINGITIDYRYFSPVKKKDKTKYPLVVWFHGLGDGESEGKQIISSNIAAWATEDYQSRFKDAGGAFIIAPRSDAGQNTWSDDYIAVVRAALDDFIAENKKNIDVSRIYVGGYSMGGKMTLKMLAAYPEMFAAGFPICPAWVPSEEATACFKDVPVWLTSGVNDPLVNYFAFASTTWNNIISQSNVAEQCRFSTLSSVRYPDGRRADSGHHSWFSVNNDMFSAEGGDYPKMKTVDGNGERVTFTYPDGMISWLSLFESDYDGSPAENGGNEEAYSGFAMNIFSFISSFFRNLVNYIKDLF